MKNWWNTVVSAIGMLILFASFVIYEAGGNRAWGTIKLTDIMIILGGLMFILPFFFSSVVRKSADNAPNRFVWFWLPLIGIVLVVVGILLPNSVASIGSVSLPDWMYLFGCLFMLLIFCYPPNEVKQEMLEDDVERMTGTQDASSASRH